GPQRCPDRRASGCPRPDPAEAQGRLTNTKKPALPAGRTGNRFTGMEEAYSAFSVLISSAGACVWMLATVSFLSTEALWPAQPAAAVATEKPSTAAAARIVFMRVSFVYGTNGG